MKIFYFTATGNNLYVAKTFKANLYSIPAVLKNGPYQYEDEKIGIIFPCYFLGMPRIVKEFFERVKLISDYVFVIVTYGSFTMGTYNQVKKLAKQSGLEISYINRVKMVDNFIPMFDITKELKKKDDQVINDKIIAIVRDVMRDKKKRPYSNFFANIISMISHGSYIKKQGTFDRYFYITDACNGCKVCERVCPVNNIEVKVKPEYKHNCDYCLACTNLCPQNAIRMKNEKSKARYLNSEVELREIIEPNSRAKAIKN